MQWVCYIGGKNRKGDLSAIQIALTDDVDKYLSMLAPTQPYELILLGWEEGDEVTLEERRSKFKSPLRNGWVKANPEIEEFIKGLPRVDRKVKLQKICVDWTPTEVSAIKLGGERLGIKVKTKIIRRAVKFYLALTAYKAKGWTVQVIKDGKFKAFHDLDYIEDPD